MTWDTAIAVAKTVYANCPDICFRNKKTNTCLALISVVLLMACYITRKQAEELGKYSELWTEVSHMWQC